MIPSCLRPSPEWGLIGLFVAMQLVFYLAGLGAGPDNLADSDCYMRLVRVEQLAQERNWYDSTIHRDNSPNGTPMHWTRPMDVLLLAGTFILTPLLGWDRALFAWSVAISPVLLGSSAALALWAFRIRRQTNRMLATLLLLCQPALLQLCAPGRPDHHSLLILSYVFALGGLHRILSSRATTKDAWLCGLAHALGIWISVEFWYLTALSWAAITLRAIALPRPGIQLNFSFGTSLSAFLFAALLLETRPSEWCTSIPDKLSLLHLGVSLIVTVAWGAVLMLSRKGFLVSSWKSRCALHLAGGMAAGIFVALLLPGTFQSPYRMLDPRIAKVWLDSVAEYQSIGSFVALPWTAFLVWLPSLVVIAGWTIYKCLKGSGIRGILPRSPFGIFTLSAGVLCGFLAYIQFRWIGYAEVLLMFPLLCVSLRILGSVRRACAGNFTIISLSRIATTIILACGFLPFTLLASNSPTAASPAPAPPPCCSTKPPAVLPLPENPAKLSEIAPFLNSHPEWKDAVILAPVDDGPEILYRTRLRTVASPYHRNGSGMLDALDILTAGDESSSRLLVEKRGIRLILLRGSEGESVFPGAFAFPGSLYIRLWQGHAPDWLQAVALPQSISGRCRIYEVIPTDAPAS